MKRRIFLLFSLLLAVIAIFLVVRGQKEQVVGESEEIGAEAAVYAAGQASISGRVMLRDGTGIGGARVRAISLEAGKEEELEDRVEEVISQADGSFAFEVLLPGRYGLDVVEAEGFVRVGPPGVGMREVVVLDGTAGRAGVSGVELFLHRPGTISGRVMAAGKAVGGARLSLGYMFGEGVNGEGLEPFSLGEAVETKANGTFSFENVAPGRLRIMVETEAYAFAESREIFLRGGETRNGVLIDLVESGSIVGRVTAQGEGIGAEVVLLGSAELGRARRVVADAGGNFEFLNVPVGRFSMRVQASGYRSVLVEVEVEDGGETRRDVSLSAATGIFGRVVDAEKKPVAGALVWFRAADSAGGEGRPGEVVVRAGQDGAFEWQDPPGGSWTAVAISPFHGSSARVVARHEQEMMLELRAGGAVAGRVIDASGQPVTTYAIAVEEFVAADGEGVPYNRAEIGRLQISQADGAFEFGQLRPGTYRFRVQATGLAPGFSDRVVVQPGARRSGVEVRLHEGAMVRGTVRVMGSQEPIAGALVELLEPTSLLPSNTVRTDASGNYELRGIPAGRHSLRVTHERYLSEFSSGVEVARGGVLRRDIQMTERGRGDVFAFQGIGAVLQSGARGIEVRSVMEGTPAEAFGLQPGDAILAVDRERTAEMDLQRVVDMIRGEAGAPVQIEIEREGEGRMTLNLERGRVVVKNSDGVANQ